MEVAILKQGLIYSRVHISHSKGLVLNILSITISKLNTFPLVKVFL